MYYNFFSCQVQLLFSFIQDNNYNKSSLEKMSSRQYTLKEFISDLRDECENLRSVFMLKDWIDSVRDELNCNYTFGYDECGSSAKISAILRHFVELEYKKGNIQMDFPKFISFLRKAKDPAIRNKWSAGQIDETVKIISAGFTSYVSTTDEELTNSNSESAFSSDDN